MVVVRPELRKRKPAQTTVAPCLQKVTNGGIALFDNVDGANISDLGFIDTFSKWRSRPAHLDLLSRPHDEPRLSHMFQL